MNKKVFRVMITLVVAFLLALYILKIFFPQQFVLMVENPQIVKIGNYIDSHKWAYYLFGIVTSFITYWLYFCATIKKWYLNWWQVLIVFAVIGASIGLSFYNPMSSSTLQILAMLLLPILFKGDTKNTLIVFSIHYLAQSLTLQIRNLPLYMTAMNSVTLYIVGIESFVWLLLFYISFNYKVKEAK